MSRTTMLAVGMTAAMALGAAQAQAQTNNSNTMSPPAMNNSSGNAAGMAHKASKADQHFLTEAMQGDMAEVQMGKLAQQKGQSEDVKQFGQMLEQDHSQHLQQAEQQAQQLGVTAPQGPNAKQKAKLIDAKKHAIITGVHPSPMSADNGFFGSKPFSKVNEALEDAGQPPIDWKLPDVAK